MGVDEAWRQHSHSSVITYGQMRTFFVPLHCEAPSTENAHFCMQKSSFVISTPMNQDVIEIRMYKSSGDLADQGSVAGRIEKRTEVQLLLLDDGLFVSPRGPRGSRLHRGHVRGRP